MSERKRILIVDDEPVTREVLGAILSRAGYEVSFAEDGVSAIQKAAAEKPDLVITDGLLPKMHGFLVCRTIKEMENPPKVIVLTGVYTKLTYKWSVKVEYHADEVLNKPFDKDILLACIKGLLKGSADVEQAAQVVSMPTSNRDKEKGFDVIKAQTPVDEALERKIG
ncbi:MAG TPA: response regulator [Blastocatellia bacterium]|nr:response regulator [Blastocatellia bacterium]